MNLISIDDAPDSLIKSILTTKPNQQKDKILATLFFEPSTRTRISFESSAHALGMKVISAENLSIKKGESIKDTLSTISRLVNLIVIRTPNNIFQDTQLLENVKCPIINAGNGSDEHPTQALLDFFTIKKNTSGKKILFVGDIKHSRTYNSLNKLLQRFSYEILTYSHPKCQVAGSNEINPSRVRDILSEIDILYMIRPQRERFEDNISFDRFKITPEWLESLNASAIILHPLPRTEEIPEFVDKDNRAKYFEQVENGLIVRKRLISYILENVKL